MHHINIRLLETWDTAMLQGCSDLNRSLARRQLFQGQVQKAASCYDITRTCQKILKARRKREAEGKSSFDRVGRRTKGSRVSSTRRRSNP
jgi:hypothetical protein